MDEHDFEQDTASDGRRAPAPDVEPEPDATPPADRPDRRSRRRAVLAATALALTLVLTLGFVASLLIHIDYYTEAPGDAVPVQPMVAIDGGPSYEAEGSFMLLYIRRRDRISVLRWIQAQLDPDMDAERGDYDAPGQSPADRDASSTSDMANAQLAARTLALARIGESVSVLPGLLVTSTIDGRPADDVLEPGDVLLSVDGTEIGPGEGRVLAETIGALRPGDSVEIEYERDGERATASIRTASNGADPPVAIIGVFVEPRYEFPFDIAFEGQIEQIGGPSAGLAMTLAVLDELTAGELSGGVDVAVTGTIDIEGNVGPVGRVDLKAKAAKRRGATLMLVPECPEPAEPDAYASPADHGLAVDFYEACEAEVRKAADTIDTVVEVATLDDALAALADAGGDPLPTPQSGATTTSRA